MARIVGTARDDHLTGTSATDSPTGVDDIFGLAGNDRIDGRSGGDPLFGGPGDDRLAGGLGDDLLFGRNGRDVLLGDDGDDLLAGDAGDDTLLGGAGDDLLQGGPGDDALFGDAGDDVLDGGPGHDRLSGDAGADRFLLADLNPDEILDLSLGEGDVVDFSALAQQALSAGLSLAEAVRLEAGPFGTTLLVDVGDGNGNGNGFQEAALLRGVEPVVEVTSNGELVAVVRPVANSLVSLSFADLDGSNGFRVDGVEPFEDSGHSVSGAGDVNGDGFADVVVGAPYTFYGLPYTGKSYVVFGDPAGFGGALELAALDGSNGFRLDGIDLYDRAGVSVSGAGDVNGDGFADVIVSAPNFYSDLEGPRPGESYVVFGDPTGFGGVLDLAALDGSNGFRLDGIAPYDNTGASVSGAGDVNGDGFADLIVGARLRPFVGPGEDGNFVGESYVVFGDPGGFGGALDLEALDGSNGFRLAGIDFYDYSGSSVSGAGDVNGDGFADLIIGAPGAATAGGPGESYVVFGNPGGFGGALDLADLDGSNGFRLDGIDPGDQSGVAVSDAGDVNGDGLADLIIGAPRADRGGDSVAGESYVVFGDPGGFGGALDLTALDGTNGFRLDGIDLYDGSGDSVSGAGDVNGDGFADLIIGAVGGDPGGRYGAGESYVVFGDPAGFGGVLDLAALDGSNGFRLDGIDSSDFSGSSVSGAGDVNGDGFADLIVGAPGADPGGDASAGESYVVFGGNFTGAVDGLGGDGDDFFIGTGAGEVFIGGRGDDTLIGNDGADLLNGAAGDDLLAIGDLGFRQLQGGSGFDTVRMDTFGASLDLTAIPDPFVESIEAFDLNGNGNALVLDRLEILNIADDSNALFVFGDETNAVQGDLTGAVEGAATVDNVDFQTFTIGQAELFVQTGVDASGVETAVV